MLEANTVQDTSSTAASRTVMTRAGPSPPQFDRGRASVVPRKHVLAGVVGDGGGGGATSLATARAGRASENLTVTGPGMLTGKGADVWRTIGRASSAVTEEGVNTGLYFPDAGSPDLHISCNRIIDGRVAQSRGQAMYKKELRPVATKHVAFLMLQYSLSKNDQGVSR